MRMDGFFPFFFFPSFLSRLPRFIFSFPSSFLPTLFLSPSLSPSSPPPSLSLLLSFPHSLLSPSSSPLFLLSFFPSGRDSRLPPPSSPSVILYHILCTGCGACMALRA